MRLYAVLATLVAVISLASAQPRPEARARADRPGVVATTPVVPPPPPASVTLRQGVVGAHLAFELGMSSDAFAQPASIAPDLAVGITDRFTLGIIHSGSALSGFRGSAGWGVCFTGTDAACRRTYTAGGVEALLSIARGSAALAADVGVIWSVFEPSVHTDLKLGFKLKMTEGNVFVWFQPNVWLALDDRSDRDVPHEHQVFLPISVWVKPTTKLALGVGTGVKGPVKNFDDRMAIPIGPLLQFTLDPRVSVGASFVFGKLFAGNDVMDPGLDARVLQIWLNLSSG